MNPLTTLVRSLGNERAIANAEVALATSAQEGWLVQGLAQRLDRRDALRAAQPAATRPTSSAA